MNIWVPTRLGTTAPWQQSMQLEVGVGKMAAIGLPCWQTGGSSGKNVLQAESSGCQVEQEESGMSNKAETPTTRYKREKLYLLLQDVFQQMVQFKSERRQQTVGISS